MQWEDKAIGHSIDDALNDIQAKTAVWTPLYYGNIKVCMTQIDLADGLLYMQRAAATLWLAAAAADDELIAGVSAAVQRSCEALPTHRLPPSLRSTCRALWLSDPGSSLRL